MLDASIYGNLGRGVKSVQEYDAEAQANQANKLALMLHKAQYDEYGRKVADDNALRQVVSQFGTDDNANVQSLFKAGRLGEGQAYQKSILDAQKARGEVKKTDAETDAKKIESSIKAHDFHTQLLGSLSDPAQVPGWVQAGVQSGVFPAEQAPGIMQRFQAAMQQPGGFAQWKQAGLQGGMTATEQLKRQLEQQKFGLQNANEIMTSDGAGGYAVNQPYVDAKKKVAKAGASNIDVRVENKVGDSVAKEVGPMMRESYEQATGAQSQITTADQLIKAIDSGKTITGPGASLRLEAAQLASTLGIAGKDTAEKIANTRATIQGLAQSTVSARAALKGQGQVSDYEGRLLQRAASGEIDDMTAAEIKQIATVNKRLAETSISLHRQRTDKMRKHQSTDGIADFYDLGTTPQAPQASPAAPAAGDTSGWKVVR